MVMSLTFIPENMETFGLGLLTFILAATQARNVYFAHFIKFLNVFCEFISSCPMYPLLINFQPFWPSQDTLKPSYKCRNCTPV